MADFTVVNSLPVDSIGDVDPSSFTGLLTAVDEDRFPKHMTFVAGFTDRQVDLLEPVGSSDRFNQEDLDSFKVFVGFFSRALEQTRRDAISQFGLNKGLVSLTVSAAAIRPNTVQVASEWHMDSARFIGCELVAGYLMRNRTPFTQVAVGEIPVNNFRVPKVLCQAVVNDQGMPVGTTRVQELAPELKIWRLPYATVHRSGTNKTSRTIFDALMVKANYNRVLDAESLNSQYTMFDGSAIGDRFTGPPSLMVA